MNIYENWGYYQEYGDDIPRRGFEGIYDVQLFVRNQDTILPLTTDTSRWRKLFVGNNGAASIQLMNDSSQRFWLKNDDSLKAWHFENRNDSNYRFTFSYSKSDSANLVLSGSIRKDSLQIHLHKLPENYLLRNRGFHWINEYPFNR